MNAQSTDLLMHDDVGEALSLQDLSTGGYSQSSDVGHSTDATVAHDTSSDSLVQEKYLMVKQWLGTG